MVVISIYCYIKDRTDNFMKEEIYYIRFFDIKV